MTHPQFDFRARPHLGARLMAFTLAVGIALVALGAGAEQAAATTTPPAASIVLASASKSPPTTSGAAGGPGIQVGPSRGGSAPSAPASGSGGNVSGGGSSGGGGILGIFDVTGDIESAIDSWFRDLVTTALNPVLTLLSNTLIDTPDVTTNRDVSSLWQVTEGIADGLLVLFVLVGGAIVMGYETVQTRTAAKDIIPRIVVAGITVNASLSIASLAINTADSLFAAILGPGVDPSQAGTVLHQLILGSLSSGGIFIILLGGVVAVLVVVLLATYIIRLALVTLLIVAAPIFLMCHALPQTEGLAKLWWRAFAGALLVQIAQSLVLVVALRVFLTSGGPANLGISSTGGVVDLLVSVCVCWVMIKIPSWVSRMVFTNNSGSRGGVVSHVVRDVVVYKGVQALVSDVRR